MDFYGIEITGDVDVGTDNSFDIGDITHRIKEVFAVTFNGETTSALWGDLAEKYLCKGECLIGTVMCGSEDTQIDLEECQTDLASNCVGVISEKPGFKLNEGLEGGKYVALTGRVPVRVAGVINKGRFIVPTTNGCAREGKDSEIAYKIGIANEFNNIVEEKLVECIIK